MKKHAFTLLDLLVVIALMALLTATLLPALAKTTPNTKALQCLNNHRQLANAWRMYADDNRDLIVYASEDGYGTSHPQNQYAWTGTALDFNPGNSANWDTNADMVVRPLWPYTGRSATIYKCPSDRSTVVMNGIPKPRVRSVSMNLYLGGFAATDGGYAPISAYRIFLKTTELSRPSPSKAFVFLDDRPDVIGYGNFWTDMSGYSPTQPGLYSFADFPGFYHNLGCSFSFADGRAEVKRWHDVRTTPAQVPGSTASANNTDIAWLQDHATRPK